MSNTKNRTSQGVIAEIERIKKTNTRRNEKITQLRAEIVADNAKIKELEKLYKKLNEAELQSKISNIWFRKKQLSDEQILKFLAISEQIGDKIDSLDIETITAMIMGDSGNSSGKKPTMAKPASKADEPTADVPDEDPEIPPDSQE
jgi:TolA-binding protein